MATLVQILCLGVILLSARYCYRWYKNHKSEEKLEENPKSVQKDERDEGLEQAYKMVGGVAFSILFNWIFMAILVVGFLILAPIMVLESFGGL